MPPYLLIFNFKLLSREFRIFSWLGPFLVLKPLFLPAFLNCFISCSSDKQIPLSFYFQLSVSGHFLHKVWSFHSFYYSPLYASVLWLYYMLHKKEGINFLNYLKKFLWMLNDVFLNFRAVNMDNFGLKNVSDMYYCPFHHYLLHCRETTFMDH